VHFLIVNNIFDILLQTIMAKKSKKKGDFQKVKLKVGKKLNKPTLTDTRFKTSKITIVSRFTPTTSTENDAASKQTTAAASHDTDDDVRAQIHVRVLSIFRFISKLPFCRKIARFSCTPTICAQRTRASHCVACSRNTPRKRRHTLVLF
jgi:hypothetical protein